MSALSLGRTATVAASTAPGAVIAEHGYSLAVNTSGLEHTKVAQTNSLQCPRGVKSPVPQNSISVRDLFPLAAAARAKSASPPAANVDHCNSNHFPSAIRLSAAGSQQLPPVPSPRIKLTQLSPVSSTEESYHASRERLAAMGFTASVFS